MNKTERLQNYQLFPLWILHYIHHRDPAQVVETCTQFYTFLHRSAQRVSRCLGWPLISVRSNKMWLIRSSRFCTSSSIMFCVMHSHKQKIKCVQIRRKWSPHNPPPMENSYSTNYTHGTKIERGITNIKGTFINSRGSFPSRKFHQDNLLSCMVKYSNHLQFQPQTVILNLCWNEGHWVLIHVGCGNHSNHSLWTPLHCWLLVWLTHRPWW